MWVSYYSGIILPGFHVSDNAQSDDSQSFVIPDYFSIGENVYFTVTNSNIYALLNHVSINGDAPGSSTPFTFNSGIFCLNNERSTGISMVSFSTNDGMEIYDFDPTSEKTLENILPIAIGSGDNDTKILDMKYIPQTKCIDLAVAVNENEIVVYIYHLETDAVDRHIIAFAHHIYEIPTSVNHMMGLYVNDNFITAVIKPDNRSDARYTCIETDKTAESVIRSSVRYEERIDYGYGYKADLADIWRDRICIFPEDDLIYIVNAVRNDGYESDCVFDRYRLYINVIKDYELGFRSHN
jgi:hypothetical protein